jgi:hypothetical protein
MYFDMASPDGKQLSDKGRVGMFPKLKKLVVSKANNMGELKSLVSNMGHMPHLDMLVLDKVQFDENELISAIQPLTSLTSLQVGSTRMFGDGAQARIAASMPNLVNIDIPARWIPGLPQFRSAPTYIHPEGEASEHDDADPNASEHDDADRIAAQILYEIRRSGTVRNRQAESFGHDESPRKHSRYQ